MRKATGQGELARAVRSPGKLLDREPEIRHPGLGVGVASIDGATLLDDQLVRNGGLGGRCTCWYDGSSRRRRLLLWLLLRLGDHCCRSSAWSDGLRRRRWLLLRLLLRRGRVGLGGRLLRSWRRLRCGSGLWRCGGCCCLSSSRFCCRSASIISELVGPVQDNTQQLLRRRASQYNWRALTEGLADVELAGPDLADRLAQRGVGGPLLLLRLSPHRAATLQRAIDRARLDLRRRAIGDES